MGALKYGTEIREAAGKLRANGFTYREIADKLSVPASTIREWPNMADRPQQAISAISPEDAKQMLRHQEELARAREETFRWKRLYATVDQEFRELRAYSGLSERARTPEIITISKRAPSEDTEAIATMIASDWHVEEIVRSETVNGLNEYNPEIAEKRAQAFFRNGLRLLDICRRDVDVTTLVLPLLGDFITNELHEDSVESNAMAPIDAMVFAQELIASGITFLLKNFDGPIVVPCHSGNHGRVTKRVHGAMEHGHSLEYFMYRNLASFFKGENRVTFHVHQSYHSYIDYFDLTVRMHHGHATRYHGGVGGLYIPVNKAIAQWNKANPADLDLFGHFHQAKDGGNFLSNGSLIGYSDFGIRIKADYEVPRQQFFLVDSKRGRTITAPILVEE